MHYSGALGNVEYPLIAITARSTLTRIGSNCYDLFFWVGRVFVNGPGDLASIPGHVIPKILKMVIDNSLLNTQHYKICIKGKVGAITGKE